MSREHKVADINVCCGIPWSTNVDWISRCWGGQRRRILLCTNEHSIDEHAEQTRAHSHHDTLLHAARRIKGEHTA